MAVGVKQQRDGELKEHDFKGEKNGAMEYWVCLFCYVPVLRGDLYSG